MNKSKIKPVLVLCIESPIRGPIPSVTVSILTEVFPSHKTMFSSYDIYAYDLENFFYF